MTGAQGDRRPGHRARACSRRTGHIAGPAVRRRRSSRSALCADAAREIGRLDLGQAVVATGRRLIAAEDIGGTDALLGRVRDLRAAGLTGDGSGPLVLAKAAKPGQPDFVDLPAIGPDTVANAAAAGIGIIAVEAGRTILDRPRGAGRGGGCGRDQHRRPRRSMADPLRLFILAGEPSGDELGADLVRRLRQARRASSSRASAVPRSIAEGLDSLFPMSDLSVMGWIDVLPRLPLLLWRARQVARAILAAAARRRRVRRCTGLLEDGRGAGAARRAARCRSCSTLRPPCGPTARSAQRRSTAVFDEVLGILPFEPKVMGELGGPPTSFVGHPASARYAARESVPGDGAAAPAAGQPRAASCAGICRCFAMSATALAQPSAGDRARAADDHCRRAALAAGCRRLAGAVPNVITGADAQPDCVCRRRRRCRRHGHDHPRAGARRRADGRRPTSATRGRRSACSTTRSRTSRCPTSCSAGR